MTASWFTIVDPTDGSTEMLASWEDDDEVHTQVCIPVGEDGEPI